ncbi:MAG: histidine phosphatase family protein [Planctomycetota bacterium]
MGSILLAPAGTTAWDEQRRLQGSRSLPLSPTGRERVHEMASQLTEMPLRTVYTGNSRHCLESARILAQDCRCRVRCLDALAEVNHGLWEGLPLAELERRYQRSYRAWLREPEAVQPPEGESLAHAYARAHRALGWIVHRHRDHLVGVVAPRLMRALIQCCLRGRGPEAVWDLYREDAQWEVFSVPDSIEGRA